jgi:general secretion pathway protein G
MSYIRTGKDKDGRGYTIFSGIHVSLLFLALIIFGILAVMIIPRFGTRVSEARYHVAKAYITVISEVLEQYKTDNGCFPTTEQGLKALIEKPSPSPSNWTGPYLKQELIDPWQKPYQYRCPPHNNQQGFDLWSSGPDGKDGTNDDITNWVK